MSLQEKEKKTKLFFFFLIFVVVVVQVSSLSLTFSGFEVVYEQSFSILGKYTETKIIRKEKKQNSQSFLFSSSFWFIVIFNLLPIRFLFCLHEFYVSLNYTESLSFSLSVPFLRCSNFSTHLIICIFGQR